MGDNYGISISGGELSADVLAVGTRARAQKRAPEVDAGLAEVCARFDRLVDELRAHRDELENVDSLIQRVQETQTEVQDAERPDRHRLLGVLRGIAEAVSPVASLAAAVQSVEQSVTNLF